MTVEEINQSYQDFQDELATRELHLKLLPAFKDERLDDLISLLNEIREAPPILIDQKYLTPDNPREKAT
ncbi:MAG: hypothetical protein J5705_04745 [Bacteroidaceae bacterium]|nr:hypothetical protein [Bacteroidaceae bacterium]